MPKIKTREKVQGIKTLDKAAVAGERMKEVYIRSKEQFINLTDDRSDNPNAYAGDKVQRAAENAAEDTARAAAAGAKLAVKKETAAIKQRRERFAEPMQESAMPNQPWGENDITPQKQSQRQAAIRAQQVKTNRKTAGKDAPRIKIGQQTVSRVSNDPVEQGRTLAKSKAVRQLKAAQIKQRQSAIVSSDRTIIPAETSFHDCVVHGSQHSANLEKSVIKSRETVLSSSKTAAKEAISPKTNRLRIKSAAREVQLARQTAQYATAVEHRSAEAAVKSTEISAQAFRTATKQTAAMSKRAAEATKEVLRAIIASMRSMVAALTAGSGVTCMVIVVVCLIGMMAGSCFGIFFSGEDSGTGMTMRDAARESNQEYNEKIEKIKTDHPYDKLILSGSRATWPEILSIYAVKTTSDQSDGQEVASMNDMKLELLRKVFWDMNSISYRVERHTKSSGKDKTTVVYLHITISHKTTDEMADQYHFNSGQKKQLAELLDEKYRSLWSSVLYGIGTGDGEIVTIALSQLGNVGGQPYWSWYGFTSRVEWCACFVSWCANECGYIDAGVIPSFSLCSDGSDWFKARSQWQERDYEPCAGDIIFFDWGGDGVPDHVGIVEKTEGGTVYTVEGNSGDACRENSYPVGDVRIYGYGVPMYS